MSSKYILLQIFLQFFLRYHPFYVVKSKIKQPQKFELFALTNLKLRTKHIPYSRIILDPNKTQKIQI